MNNAFRKEPDAEKPHVRNSVRDTFGNGCIYSTKYETYKTLQETENGLWAEYIADRYYEEAEGNLAAVEGNG